MTKITKENTIERLSYMPERVIEAHLRKQRLLDFLPKIKLNDQNDLEIAKKWRAWMCLKKTPCATVSITKTIGVMYTLY
jgi:hypothetical protein